MTGRPPRESALGPLAGMLGALLVALLVLPLSTLALSASPDDIRDGLQSPLFLPALALSARTTLLSIAVTIVTGTPLAFWLATSRSRLARATELVVELPIVIPPAVMGISLLQTYGRQGLLGPALSAVGVHIPFTEGAVLLAQIVVSAPFFVQAASNAFRKLDMDLLIVARSLGASPSVAFFRVALPVALPGLVVGASLAWARALGEFGATLLFAGNSPGNTQTMPLAILSALESDVKAAVAFSLVLGGLGSLLLLGLRLLPAAWSWVGSGAELPSLAKQVRR